MVRMSCDRKYVHVSLFAGWVACARQIPVSCVEPATIAGIYKPKGTTEKLLFTFQHHGHVVNVFLYSNFSKFNPYIVYRHSVMFRSSNGIINIMLYDETALQDQAYSPC